MAINAHEEDMDGRRVRRLGERDDARTQHTLHYGTGAFEGIRAYKTDKGLAIFRLAASTWSDCSTVARS